MVAGIRVKPDAMRAAAAQGFATATDLADYLVRKGLPFRDAHEVVARAVRHAEGRGCDLSDLALAELQQFSAAIGGDVFDVLRLDGSVASRNHIGGTAPGQVLQAVGAARSLIAA
jgi:argininosuccinate lyase